MEEILKYDEIENMKVDESAIVNDLLRATEKGLLVDVGANIGGVSKLFAERGWNVIAFEPDPNNLAMFKKNTEGFDSIRVFTDAISDTDGMEVTFYSSPESIGISSMLAFTEGHKPICTVKTKTLASFVKENEIEAIDFLKIDVEGYDYFVLKGCDWNCGVKPSVIVCEFEDRKTRLLSYDAIQMADYLVDKGYEVFVSEWYPLTRYGGNPSFNSLKKYPCDIDTESTGNFIAFRDKCSVEALKEAFLRSVEKHAPPKERYSYSERAALIKRIKEGSVKVIGWGTGASYQSGKYYKIPVSMLIDGRGGGGQLDGLTIYGPERLLEEDAENTVIVVFSMFYDEIRGKIDEYGEFTSIAIRNFR